MFWGSLAVAPFINYSFDKQEIQAPTDRRSRTPDQACILQPIERTIPLASVNQVQTPDDDEFSVNEEDIFFAISAACAFYAVTEK